MHKCIICNNCSSNNETPITFHSIPKDPQRRKRWLKCLKIKNCYDWFRVCSAHFSKEDYKPGGKRWLFHAAVPKLQPHEEVDMPFTEKCTSNNTDIALCSPSTSTHIGELSCINNEHDAEQTLESSEITDDNPTANNIGAPRRSSRKSKPVTTEDFVMYSNKSTIQNNKLQKVELTNTEEVQGNEDNVPIPELNTPKPKISVGSGMRCSVKNCLNTQSNTNGVTFHGYPISNNDLLQRWIQNCGIQDSVKPNEKFKTNLKVCGCHFEDKMYMTSHKKKLKQDAIPTLFFNNDENNISQSTYPENEDIQMIECASNSSPVTKLRTESEFQSTEIMVEPINSHLHKGIIDEPKTQNILSPNNTENLKCCVPDCDIRSIGDRCITLYTPSSNEVANEWSYILDLPLNVDSVLCEKHFYPDHIKHEQMKFEKTVENKKLSTPGAVPTIVKNKCASKRQMVNNVNDDLLTKKIKNNLTDESQTTTMCTEDEYIDMNSSDVIINPKLNGSTQPPSATIFKTTITDDSDTQSSLNHILPKILANSSLSISLHSSNIPVAESETESANNTLLTITDDHDNCSQSSFEQMSSSNTSVSITLKSGIMSRPVSTIEPNKVIPADILKSRLVSNTEPEDIVTSISSNSSSHSRLNELISKTLSNSSVSISLKNNISPTSASPSSSEYDAARTSKYINNQIALLKKSAPNDFRTSKIYEKNIHNIEFNCNSNYSKNMSIVENANNDDLIFNDVHCIHNLSRNFVLPNYFWKSVLCKKNQYKTIFIQRDYSMKIIKKVYFYNSLVPIIFINNKRYAYNENIETKNELENLLEKIDDIEICMGYDGYMHEQCIGYFENSSKDTESCCNCQELTKDEHLYKVELILKDKSNKIVELENQIAEKEVRLNERRRIYKNEKRNEKIHKVLSTLKPPYSLLGPI